MTTNSTIATTGVDMSTSTRAEYDTTSQMTTNTVTDISSTQILPSTENTVHVSSSTPFYSTTQEKIASSIPTAEPTINPSTGSGSGSEISSNNSTDSFSISETALIVIVLISAFLVCCCMLLVTCALMMKYFAKGKQAANIGHENEMELRTHLSNLTTQQRQQKQMAQQQQQQHVEQSNMVQLSRILSTSDTSMHNRNARGELLVK